MMGWVHVRGSWAVKHTPAAQTLGIFFRVTKIYNAMPSQLPQLLPFNHLMSSAPVTISVSTSSPSSLSRPSSTSQGGLQGGVMALVSLTGVWPPPAISSVI